MLFIFDCVVDIRKGSETFGKWVGVVLDDQKRQMLYIPEGFAHGFCVLSETVDILYQCTEVYSPEHERGLLWNDPQIGVQWPVEDPILSERDAAFPALDGIENNFNYDK